jgi:trigger factor
MTTVIDNSTISSLPQTVLDYYKAMINYQLEQEAAMYGVDSATYMSQLGLTQEYIDSMIDAYATQNLIITAVAQAEKMEATEDEYKEAVTNYITSYGVETEEDLLKQVTKDEIMDSVVMKKAYDYIIDNAVVK